MAIAGGLGSNINPSTGGGYAYKPTPARQNDYGPTAAEKSYNFNNSNQEQEWAGARYAALMQGQNNAMSGYNAFWNGLQGLNDRWAQDQEGYINSGGALDQQYLDWQRQGVADDIRDADQNLAYRDQIIGNLQQMFGINDRNLANQIAQSLLDQQVRANQATWDARDRAQQLRSTGIAQGSMSAPGQIIGQRQITEGRDNTLLGINRGAELTREGYNIDADRARLGLQNQILEQQRGRVGDLASQRNANRAGQGFDIKSRQNQNQLAQQLAQLRYKNTSDQFNQALSWLNSGNQNQVQAAQNFFDNARKAGGW